MELVDRVNRRVLLLGALVVVAAVAAFVVLVVLPDDGDSDAPAAWDPAVIGLVEWVQQARGLGFTAPLRVEAVDDAGFAAAVGADEPSEADLAAAGRTVQVVRALGLATERTDDADLAAEAVRHVLDGGVRARYLPHSGRIVVRADALDDLDDDTEAALVAALGTALHHQHTGIADRSPLDRGTASVGRRALSSGVGAALADRYVVEVQERELREWRLAEVRPWDESAVGLVAAYSGVFDELGEPLVSVALVDETPGEGRNWTPVVALLAAPPRTELELLQPWAALDGFERVAVAEPEVEGHEVIDTGDFGAATLYLTAALRADPREALAASLGWAGDSAVLSRDPDGRLCLAVAFEGIDGDASDRIESVLDDWAAGAPPSSGAAVERDGRRVTLRSCEARRGDDPGIELDPGTVVAVPVSRTDLIAELRDEGRRRENAVCVADLVIEAIPVLALTDADRPPEAEALYDMLRRDSDRACRRV